MRYFLELNSSLQKRQNKTIPQTPRLKEKILAIKYQNNVPYTCGDKNRRSSPSTSINHCPNVITRGIKGMKTFLPSHSYIMTID